MGLFNIFGGNDSYYQGTAQNQFRQLQRDYYDGNITAKDALIHLLDLTEYRNRNLHSDDSYDNNLIILNNVASSLHFYDDNYEYVIRDARPAEVERQLEYLFRNLSKNELKIH